MVKGNCTQQTKEIGEHNDVNYSSEHLCYALTTGKQSIN